MSTRGNITGNELRMDKLPGDLGTGLSMDEYAIMEHLCAIFRARFAKEYREFEKQTKLPTTSIGIMGDEEYAVIQCTGNRADAIGFQFRRRVSAEVEAQIPHVRMTTHVDNWKFDPIPRGGSAFAQCLVVYKLDEAGQRMHKK
jgi:hypothetical protein